MTRQRFVLSMALTFVFAGCDGGDDDVCADCSCDPSLCDDADADADADGEVGPDGDADADADSDSDVGPDGDAPVEYGSLTVASTPVEGATIELDGEPTGQNTNYTFEGLLTGPHSVLLSLAGRLQVSDAGELNQPSEVNVITEGTVVNIVLYWDVHGSWRNADTDAPVELEMQDRDQILAFPPTDACPNTEVIIHGLEALGAVCVEADGTLSLCKNGASSCGGRQRVDGQITNDGNQIEFTFWPSDGGPSEHYVYVRT